jgi:hypothetical protein
MAGADLAWLVSTGKSGTHLRSPRASQVRLCRPLCHLASYPTSDSAATADPLKGAAGSIPLPCVQQACHTLRGRKLRLSE